MLALLFLPLVAAQKCAVVFDGRVPSNFTPASFDVDNGLFGTSAVFGQNTSFGQLIKLPSVGGSPFDDKTIPLEVTINDLSIFAPSPDNVQSGFRRAELLPALNVASGGRDDSTTGVKTVHFSVRSDGQRPLNGSTHEYQLAFLESADFSTNQLVLKTGLVAGSNSSSNTSDLLLFGNVNTIPSPPLLFHTPFVADIFHNFAVTLDFDANTTAVRYSRGNASLQLVTATPVANNVAGQGQFHFGLLKKPIGGGDDIVHNGFQEAGIDEGIIYGGIFEEDSSDGCVSVSL